MIGHFDLSTETADVLSEFWDLSESDTNDCRYPRFVGWVEEFDGCLELLVKEIWANEGGVLTAWEQLYMLACGRRACNPFEINLRNLKRASAICQVQQM